MARGGLDCEKGTMMCALMTAVAVFISCFLLGFSFDTLAADEYGLMFNQNTRYLECDALYGHLPNQGSRRFFTGLGRGFYEYRFPLAATDILFSSSRKSADSGTIDARTNEGAAVVMELGVQYKLPRDAKKLCQVYYNFGKEHKTFYTNFIRGVSRDAISTFRVQDLWENRGLVGQAIRSAIANTLSINGATLVNFQLLSLDIPNELQAEIENTTVQFQKITTTSLNLQKQNVSAITQQLQARVTAQMTVINAQAAADAMILAATAQAQSQNITAFAEAEGYNAFKNTFSMDNQELLSLAYVDALLNTASANLVISSKTPSLVKPGI